MRKGKILVTHSRGREKKVSSIQRRKRVVPDAKKRRDNLMEEKEGKPVFFPPRGSPSGEILAKKRETMGKRGNILLLQ